MPVPKKNPTPSGVSDPAESTTAYHPLSFSFTTPQNEEAVNETEKDVTPSE
jgi:hypothetical protein